MLAKGTASPDRPEGEATLPGHTAMVVAAAEQLLEHRGRASLLAAGLDPGLEPRLRRLVLLGAATHDLGKCSDHFQQMLRGRRHEPQLIRHEALSLWLGWPGQPLASWLRAAVDTDEDLCLALVCASAHHRKFQSDAFAPEDAGAGSSLSLLVHHADFARTLALIAGKLGLPAPPAFSSAISVSVSRRAHPREQFQEWQDTFERTLPPDIPEARLLAVAKALVLAADVAGSALPRSGEKHGWVGQQLSRPRSAEGLLSVVERRLGGRPLRPFQEAVAHSRAPVTLVRAGCGSGKTAAAYAWAARQHPGRQLWLTYPTMGTATEGFRDYLHGADVEARLQHSRAEVDLDIFGLRGDGAHAGEGPRDQDRLEALRSWGVDAVTCTADTVLGLVQNQRQGLYAWPALSSACVVFDEIHAYDARLFGCLLRFLEALPGLPALLMTASLPAARREALAAMCQRVHGVPLAEVSGPEDLEALHRYQRADAQEPWPLVEACLGGEGRVLWVSNTVDRCLAIADEARRRGRSALLYHSRFRYRDRVDRHGDVVDAFRAPGSVLAATTQVAEMSLDLSADLLVTDLAPIPALIQRLGRLNRRSTPEAPAPVRPFLVLPFDGKPYDAADLGEARAWLERLGSGPLSQRDLVSAWEAPAGKDVEERLASAWLDGRFDTGPAPCRDGSPSLTVLREVDARAVEEGREKVQHVTLPMNLPPTSLPWRSWRRPGRLPYPVVPDEALAYDPLRGARWRKQ
nr:CRISPR-associated helicase Cas3' [Myxococcus sp. RHSTA-1-4]